MNHRFKSKTRQNRKDKPSDSRERNGRNAKKREQPHPLDRVLIFLVKPVAQRYEIDIEGKLPRWRERLWPDRYEYNSLMHFRHPEEMNVRLYLLVNVMKRIKRDITM